MLSSIVDHVSQQTERELMMSYTPTPIDASTVVLPEEILSLAEKLAENTHEHWAAQRLQNGWRYGPQRDDGEKLHPCLIPYNDLPESEKVYDRRTAMETLKAICALGFRIELPRD